MRVAHIFCHQATNLGDIYLREATRAAISTAFPDARFSDIETRKIFGRNDIEELNEHDMVLLGGGGLMLRDTFPNDESDWQFGCGAELLEEIVAPMVVYSIGYNRFRGQEDFMRPLFDNHVETLIRKSAFFSVRNTGSVRALKRYVSVAAGEQIALNHCPSILLPRTIVERDIGSKRVGLLLAGDRLNKRHPDLRGFASRIGSLAKEIAQRCELYVVAHQPQDLWYIEHLEGVPYTFVNLIGKPVADAMALYSSLDVMVGDRGHAQMIPFGLGCRIISLVSHDKLAWFLEDVGIEDHGIEESDLHLSDRVLSLIFADGGDTYSERRVEAMRVISRTQHNNLALIRDRISAQTHRRTDVSSVRNRRDRHQPQRRSRDRETADLGSGSSGR
jgi:polysaccharide pyruvyl transferase WcaK-like protein